MKNILDETPIYEGTIELLVSLREQLTEESERLASLDNDDQWVETIKGHERQALSEEAIARAVELKFPNSMVADIFRDFAESSRKAIAFTEELFIKFPKRNEDDDSWAIKVSFTESIIAEIDETIRYCLQEQSEDAVLAKILKLKDHDGNVLHDIISGLIIDSFDNSTYDTHEISHIYEVFVKSTLISNVEVEKQQEGNRLLKALIKNMLKVPYGV